MFPIVNIRHQLVDMIVTELLNITTVMTSRREGGGAKKYILFIDFLIDTSSIKFTQIDNPSRTLQ